MERLQVAKLYRIEVSSSRSLLHQQLDLYDIPLLFLHYFVTQLIPWDMLF